MDNRFVFPGLDRDSVKLPPGVEIDELYLLDCASQGESLNGDEVAILWRIRVDGGKEWFELFNGVVHRLKDGNYSLRAEDDYRVEGDRCWRVS